jgi:hypothetical protein
MDGNMYDEFFCAYKYYTLMWKLNLKKIWNISQFNNVYVQYMHNSYVNSILVYNISSKDI